MTISHRQWHAISELGYQLRIYGGVFGRAEGIWRVIGIRPVFNRRCALKLSGDSWRLVAVFVDVVQFGDVFSAS